MEGITLRTANPADRVALRGVRVYARLAGMSQRTTVEQTFVNLEPRAIEAVYTFPLPEGAAVCGFEVITGERVLTGTIDENDRAIEKYDDAISEGHGAFLMEQDRPDVFTVRVGNLKPRQAATIRLTYVCALDRVDKQIRVAFPTTIAPRYVTATGADPLEAMVDGVALNPPHALWVPYGLSIQVDVELGRKLAGVFSPSHAVRVERPGDDRAVVTLAAGVTEMNRDVVLTIDLPREHEPSVQLERGGPDGAEYLAVTFVPEFDVDELAEPAPTDVVFVLDCSGSMAGESLAQAKAALELCLRSLSPGDTFNVCRFGSSFELMASEPLTYSQATLDRALAYVRASGDLGGTELHAPLSAIFKVPPRPGTVRQVILLTDGQVTNEPAVIELARKHRARNRLFTFGIGAASSTFLVKGLARATGGAAEFITAGERIDEKVLRTFGRLASPMVSEVTIDWDGCDVQTLAELPPVFDGDVMAVFGRAAGRAPKRVTLSCATPAGPKRWTVPVGPGADFGGALATMWARRTIQSLEEVNAVSRVRNPTVPRQRETLVNLSKQFGLLCSQTTFIAIEHRTLEERNEGRPALRRVPVRLAEGWGGVEVAAGGAYPAMMAGRYGSAKSFHDSSPAAPMYAARLDEDEGVLDLTRESDDTAFNSVLDEVAPAAPPPPGAETGEAVKPKSRMRRLSDDILKKVTQQCARPSAAEVLGAYPQEYLDEFQAAPTDARYPQGGVNDVLGLQSADGWFAWGDDIYAGTTHRVDAWRQAVVDVTRAWLGDQPEARVTDTVAALLLLRTRFVWGAAFWRRADQKAIRWLAAAVRRSPGELETWLQSAAKEPTLTALVRT